MEPIVINFTFNAPLEKVWNALSNETELKKWYFPVEDYEFEVGKEFTFYESTESQKYFHKARFLNIIPNQLIEHTWEHPNDSKGSSVVKWELKAEGDSTKVTLTHTGTESFEDAGPDFTTANYEMGWTAIVGTSLRNYLYNISKLEFTVEIKATPQKVWQELWDKESYKTWTNPFCEGSYYEGEIKQGNRVHFLTPSGEGMFSDIFYLKENEITVIKHLGVLKNFEEQPMDEETLQWSGCFEIYKLTEVEGKTHFKAEVDSLEKYVGHMNKTFPLALQELKRISEIN
ncbi:uncharacterized protein YndB with AHSA1/START domain [Flavobacterium arsenatis]|uniref:Uncharacterized protein YndB with AHSA1/START domain n=1 Tax=Flavobacterium arsenatis TaxID=1484332 RepID=A0ABU1TNN4_9FLAO|nr:SRPBCC domain-containing protein [Flavobacterium arsenatis]MDR6967027.1 uncharacterized protein YndB with AHSA1/START domain [Flavobacterium arsenatis]